MPEPAHANPDEIRVPPVSESIQTEPRTIPLRVTLNNELSNRSAP